MKSLAIVAVCFAVLTSCGSRGTAHRASSASTNVGPRYKQVRGSWENLHAAVMSSQAIGGRSVLIGQSDSVWHGDLDGSTTWVERVYPDPKQSGAFFGDADETFIGTLRDVGKGRLVWNDRFTYSAAGAVDITSTITRGDGDLRGITGTVRFTGTATPDGRGRGSYVGSIHRQP